MLVGGRSHRLVASPSPSVDGSRSSSESPCGFVMGFVSAPCWNCVPRMPPPSPPPAELIGG
eukprot:2188264-Prymnesium_polylepis.1